MSVIYYVAPKASKAGTQPTSRQPLIQCKNGIGDADYYESIQESYRRVSSTVFVLVFDVPPVCYYISDGMKGFSCTPKPTSVSSAWSETR